MASHLFANLGDVLIIQKRTLWERSQQTALKDDTQLQAAHKEHEQTRERLITWLNKKNWTYTVVNLHDLNHSSLEITLPFFQPDHLHGILPRKHLVISLGGDGTLLHASHYVGGPDVCLLGINSSPQYSVGHLCALSLASPAKQWDKLLCEASARTLPLRRLHLQGTAKPLPLALNDVLFTNRHPAASSRYEVQINDQEPWISHISSGIWISTAAGSSAAISAYHKKSLPLESPHFLVAARELYKAQPAHPPFHKEKMDGNHDSLVLRSRMRNGLICVDGSDFTSPWRFGEEISLHAPLTAALKLVVGKDPHP